MEKEEFIIHRKNIVKNQENNSILIAFASKEVEDNYVVNKNFFYSTGINEDSDKLIIEKDSQGNIHEYLFIKPYDPIKEKWIGRGLNKEEAYNISGIEDIHYLDEFDSFVSDLLTKYNTVYLDFEEKTDNYLTDIDQYANSLLKINTHVKFLNSNNLFKIARTIKTKSEIEEIKKAIHITRLGIEELFKNSKDNLKEYQLESYFDQSIKYNGANGYAFGTIAASGKNSCCLHYSANKDTMHNGDLILFDLGSTYNNYCSDISRTFPVNGKFTPRQRQIYEIVLNGQKLMFENMKPGITQKELNQILVKYYAKELKAIGLIKEDSEVSKYYFHGVSHHMGLDCHDLCVYGPLEEGNVISNEPGLYIKEENIGIRIEDDVLITRDGCINLSSEIIKEIDDIEKFMALNNKNIIK